MLRKIFGKSITIKQKERRPSIPDGIRIYAIGDIHGRADLLQAINKKIQEDAKTSDPDCRKIVVYLGDYVDRGTQSKEVLDLLIDKPLQGFENIFIKGNHEEMLSHFIEDVSVGPVWLAYGGDACIYSYKIPAPLGTSKPEEVDKIQKKTAQSHTRQTYKIFVQLEVKLSGGRLLLCPRRGISWDPVARTEARASYVDQGWVY